MADARAVILSVAADFARRQTPYVWGGTSSSGVDCSGLVVLCYAAAGIEIGRTTWQIFDQGAEISERDALPADLVFLDTAGIRNNHVGIVVGAGQMIDAPDENLVVRQEAIWDMPRRFWRHPALDHAPIATGLTVGRLALVDTDEGLIVRRRPTTNSERIGALPDHTPVFVGPQTATADGHVWRQVAIVTPATIVVGYVASEFLKAG